MTDKPEILIRESCPDDLAFILSSWLQSYWDARRKALHSPKGVYFTQHRRVILAVMKRARVLVACEPGQENHIYGWICAEKTSSGETVLHYAYVKHPFRGFGLGSQLFGRFDEGGPFLVSHDIKPMLSGKLSHRATYSPYALFEAMSEAIKEAQK